MKMTITLKDESGRMMALTTNHATSSYGIPVLVVGGCAYGPKDLIPNPVEEAGWLEIGIDMGQNPFASADRIVRIAARDKQLDRNQKKFVDSFADAWR